MISSYFQDLPVGRVIINEKQLDDKGLLYWVRKLIEAEVIPLWFEENYSRRQLDVFCYNHRFFRPELNMEMYRYGLDEIVDEPYWSWLADIQEVKCV